ncbi:hypothetical protein GCM10011506_09890 [Marivirga lumbricoides]|uniref:Acyl carrier protein n=1 Tax=Marivirga lumbricoides TaxID=1046115 RepID=A0ABQ1LLA2_9BACT|nr:hypothetical protein GCM10011506_09890 [Marivirga lumbricoides]
MSKITSLKKIINVFQLYGIALTGKRKSANFYSGLHMERSFVQGLVFELEYELKRELADDKANTVETPQQLINYLINS